MSPMCTYTQIINKGKQKEKEEYNKVINLTITITSFGNAHKDVSISFFTNLYGKPCLIWDIIWLCMCYIWMPQLFDFSLLPLFKYFNWLEHCLQYSHFPNFLVFKYFYPGTMMEIDCQMMINHLYLIMCSVSTRIRLWRWVLELTILQYDCLLLFLPKFSWELYFCSCLDS